MSLVPEVKCRRCGESFSSLRSRCPNCGTRRVSQSGRNPNTTPGTVRGTASYDRAATNTKWQLIFGLILVVAVILAVIVMVSTSLDGADSSKTKATPPVSTVEAPPTMETPPTPVPTPTPSVDSIKIFNYTNDLTAKDDKGNDKTITMHLDTAEVVNLQAAYYPLTLEAGLPITWSVDKEGVIELTPSADGKECKLEIVGTCDGGTLLTVECCGKTATLRIYCRP